MFRKFTWLVLTILLVVPICWQPQSASTFGGARPMSGGSASLSNGRYDWINSTFYFNVTGAPPNVCGTLHTFRNGSQLDSPSWICTNGSGNATMGPYSGSSNQTDTNIYIEWPDGSQTNTISQHISDASPPSIWINSYSSGSFAGGASDVAWGTGLDFTPFGWSSIFTTFQDLTTGKYADSSGYNSTNPVYWGAAPSSYYGFNISWSGSAPPASVHNPTHSYRWCVQTNDLFYQSNIACVGFTGVP